MGVSPSLLSEEDLQCSICQHVFTDPVSTPCGHNFCMVCLRTCWDNSSLCQCPVCKEEFPQRPELRVNTFISALPAQFKKAFQVESSSTADQRLSKSQKVLCDSCTENRLEALRSCLDCGVSYCSRHLLSHSITYKMRNHKLIDPVENLENYICQKHEKPLEMFCRDDQTCVCQFCTKGDHRTHTTVPIETEMQKKKMELETTQTEVREMIKQRMKKVDEIKHSVELKQKNTEKEKADNMEVFSSLLRCIERSRTELLQVLEEKQKAAERQAEEFIKDLEQEITELKRRNTELDQISHTEDHIHLLQMYPSLCSPPHTRDWTNITINTHLSVETLRRALTQLQESLNMEMEELAKIELKRIQQCAVDVTLDPDTAHPDLILSADGKQVKYGNTQQNLPDNPARFEYSPCVLGKEGFSSGRFYYEVQVKGKVKWALGLAGETSPRKGMIICSPEDGYWSICKKKNNEYEALDSPSESLSLKQAPQKVGVFVDYEEGLVSFYDVEARAHIYSFTGQSFTGRLYPYLCPCVSVGKTSAPLCIITVEP
ncbi:zinc finger protein RFP-like [Brachyhypopomus gauderio]|uniref:zinc finger protein RFP-like n=1 Tax=Brachyhypopomus gauderio TaxID=698409 RepID=UPI004042C925